MSLGRGYRSSARRSSNSFGRSYGDGDFIGMGRTGNFFDDLFGAFGSLFNKLTGAGTTGAERETMAYNSQEAAYNRSFQSAEAEKARQWQEDFYNQYESPAAKMRQYEEAGLNPALMYGGATGASSVPSTSAPSGGSASVGLPESGVGSLLSFILDAVGLKSQINKNNADADNAEADAENKRADTGLKQQQKEWNPKLFQSEIDKNEATSSNLLAGVTKALAEVDQINQNIEESKSRIRVNDRQAELILANTGKVAIEAANESLKSQGIKANNRLLAQQVLTEVAKTALTKAQSRLASIQGDKVKFEAIEQIIDDAIYAQTGWKHGSTQWDLLYLGLMDTFTDEYKFSQDGIADMIKRIFGDPDVTFNP